MDDFAASNKFTDDDPLPAVEGGEPEYNIVKLRARIRELEAEVERLKHIITMQACPGTEGDTP
jgi:hypothetical protein